MSERKPLIQSDPKPLIQLQPRGRTHPDLVRLDGLALTYPGWQNDKSEAEEAHFKYPSLFDDKLSSMQRRQRIHAGNRSHSQLIRLDKLSKTLSYPGWQQDKDDAQRKHINYPSLFDDEIKYMEKRQKISEGDRSAPQLQRLDALKLTYPNWQQDKADAERTHVVYPNLFYDKLEELRKRERIHQGDRSDNNLRRLDALNLSYPGWQQDKADAERKHLLYPNLLDGKLEEMKKRQALHSGERSDYKIVQLDCLKLTYPGWRNDKAEAERRFVECPSLFNGKLEEIRKNEKIHQGDRSAPELRKLDALNITYLGWQNDKAEAERRFVQCPSHFNGKLEEIRKKEKIHKGDRSAPQLRQLDALNMAYPGWQQDKAEAERRFVQCPSLFNDKLEEIRKRQKACAGSSHSPIVLGGEEGGSVSSLTRPAKKRRKGGVSTTRNPIIDTSSKCVVCLQADKTHALHPCGHRCVCKKCSTWSLNQKSCPICRQKIVSAHAAAADRAPSRTVDLSNA